jgi:type I restriction enzyme, S subunit
VIADLKPYPAYRDSGVPWLGEIPAHWRAMPGRACYREKKISNVGLQETTVLSLSYGQIVIKPVEKLHGLVPASFETYQIIDPGDIIVRPTDLQNDWNSLRFGLSQYRGIITSAYMCLHTEDVMTREYGHLLLHAYDLKKVFYGLGSGLRQNLDWRDFKYLPCLVPPLPEQTAIVRYLDHVDRRIRRYIRAKQKLIALVNEEKQAIIHQAVTRGLDPNVRLKSSGVAWLGDVPEHWEVRQLGRFITLQRGFDITKEQQTHGSVPVVSSGGISSYHNQATSSGPGVVVGRKGSAGTVHYLDGAFWAHDTTLWVKAFNGNHPRYVYYVLCQLDLKRFDTGSANPTINRNIVHPEIVPFPPPGEQRTIASFLDTMLDKNGKMIDDADRQIALLREYRTRLIADVVTGKLDVRAAVAALPKEGEEPEPLDEGEALDEEVEEGDLDAAPEEADA